METTLLPIALGLIMLGLGLSLTTGDFARVAKHPKAVGIALACQVLLLPVICFGLVQLFGLPPILAVFGFSFFRIELAKDDLTPFVGLRNFLERPA